MRRVELYRKIDAMKTPSKETKRAAKYATIGFFPGSFSQWTAKEQRNGAIHLLYHRGDVTASIKVIAT